MLGKQSQIEKDIIHKTTPVPFNLEDKERCRACDGDGYIVDNDIEPGCCGNVNKYGSCCGNAIPVQVHVQVCCRYCGGTGYAQ